MGHNIYILCHQLAAHNKELAALVRASPHGANADALRYYRTHTAQIEVSVLGDCVPQVDHYIMGNIQCPHQGLMGSPGKKF